MIIDNFKFTKDLIGIEVGDLYFDLHNNFNFTGVVDEQGKISLHWRRLSGNWVPESSPWWILLTFSAPSYIDLRGKPSEDLMEFGFFKNETDGKVEYNGLSMPCPGYEIFVARFENGAEIAIRAMSAKVSIGNGA